MSHAPPLLADVDDPVVRGSRALESSLALIRDADELRALRELLNHASARGHFKPTEEEQVREVFRDYLTARAIVWSVLHELAPLALSSATASDQQSQQRIRAFTVAYAGACLLVDAGRTIVAELARHPTIRRKLDEPDPIRGIPKRQFRGLYRALTSPRNAWRLHWAREFANTHRDAISDLATDPIFTTAVRIIRESGPALQVPVRFYLGGWLRFLRYSVGQRRGTAFHKAMFGLLEASGRLVSVMRIPGYRKRVNRTVLAKFAELLQPGDVLVTRHNDAMTNLFLPGFWPHAALHIGSEQQRRQLGIELDDDRQRRCHAEVRVLEALKDGCLFRRLQDTLSVDAVVALRPRIGSESARVAIERALTHEGKLYDFGFDFFRSDRVVCTEVVYRAYDGIEGMRFELTARAGRPTLSAEDLLDCAIDRDLFEVVAIFGTPKTRRRVLLGSDAREALVESYRNKKTDHPSGGFHHL